MAVYDFTIRQRLLALPTRQLRLRNLKSIAVRNLLPFGATVDDVSKVYSYFTLHLDFQSKEFYKSETVQGSMNPTWRSFELSHMLRAPSAASTSLVVRIWAGEEDNQKLLVEWTIDLTGLQFLGNQSQLEGVKHRPNSLLFGMFDGYFGAPDSKPELKDDVSQYSVITDQNLVRKSYDTNSLCRILTILRAVKQTQASVRRVKMSIEDRLLLSLSRSKKLAEQEMLDLQLNNSRLELEWQTNFLHSEKQKHEQLQSINHQKHIMLHNKNDTLQKDKYRLQEKTQTFTRIRQEFIHLNTQLFLRQKRLVSELALIYPIEEVGDNKFNICGINLPNSEDFHGYDEIMIAVALGYTCHLVQMISQVLDVPLRYQTEHLASRSKIRDHIHDKLADKDRDFPLYSKGKERFQFNYAVYLLNKNIAQLRNYCGLGTHDLRLTLQNVKSLLELRLGVKFDHYRATIMSLNKSRSSMKEGGELSNQHPETKMRANSSFEEILIQEANKKKPPDRNSKEINNVTKDDNTQELIVERTSNKINELPDALSKNSESDSKQNSILESTVDRGSRLTIPPRTADLADSSRDSSLDQNEVKEAEMAEYYDSLVRRLTINESEPSENVSEKCDKLKTNSTSSNFKTWQTDENRPATKVDFDVSTKLFTCDTNDFNFLSSDKEDQKDSSDIADQMSLDGFESDESSHSFDGLLSGLRNDDEDKDLQLRAALLSQKMGSFHLTSAKPSDTSET